MFGESASSSHTQFFDICNAAHSVCGLNVCSAAMFAVLAQDHEQFLCGDFLCIFVSRLMGRRGWSAMPIPDGWVQVIRGPRPKAENWPRSKPSVVVQKGPRTPTNTSATHVGQVRRDPCIPRPEREDHNGQGASLQVGGSIGSNDRDGRTRGGVSSSCPQKSTRGRAGSPRRSTSEGVRGFLDESAVPFGGIGFEESDRVIMENIEASEKRLLELRTKMQAPLPTEESEVQQLRGLVSQLQAQVESLRGPSVDIHSPNPKRPCRREDFVPLCDEEFQEWMEGRRKDLQTAVETGQFSEVARISQLFAQAASEWQQGVQDKAMSLPSAMANSVL